ncbi:MAG: homocysteine S-methyltransferase family protein [Acidobacteriota bacterium]
MPISLKARLARNDALLHYAPLHSLLADWGKPLEVHLTEWILAHPDAYQDALTKSYEAGCDLASTSTQASSPWRAEVFGLRHRVHEHNYQAARLAREVTPSDRYLCGFVSSTNPDFLEPVGGLTYQEVYDGYSEQIGALLEGGVDVIMIVGNHLDESIIAIEAAKKLGPQVPVVAQNVFYNGMTGFRTMMGLDPVAATRALVEAGADVVGASCGLMKQGVPLPGETGYYQAATGLLRQIVSVARKPVSFQPNAGMAQLRADQTVYPATPAELAAEIPTWLRDGASIVGGCCGTNLEHYRLIALIVRAWNAERGRQSGRLREAVAHVPRP